MKSYALFTLAVLGLVLSACGLPTNQLTEKERVAEMQWAFRVFEHNYAPAELKKSNFGVEMSQIEADCTTMAEEEMENQEFLALFQKCIRSFKDAHVGAQQMNNGLLPEYASVKHLGFVTMRTKFGVTTPKMDALRIVKALKGSDGEGAPMVPGDLIIAVDGKSVTDYLNEEIVPFVDVGQDETSLTVASFRFGVRTSTDMALPSEDDITLRVVRGARVFDITLPWIEEDMLSFELAQNPPPEEESAEEAAEAAQGQFSTDSIGTNSPLMPTNPLASHFFGFADLVKMFSDMDNPVEYITNRVKLIATTGFKAARFNPILSSLLSDSEDEQGVAAALETRTFPQTAGVSDLMSEPMFTAKMITTDAGQKYAYIQLGSFPAEDKVLTEWFRAITAIEDKGIKAVVIDMIDNVGGSLIHGMRMLNMTRKKTINYPSLQVRLNNNWMNSFKTQAAFSEDASSKAIATKVLRDLEEDQANGLSLSRPISVTVLDPFFLQNPIYGLSDDVKIAVLVNEMCVSMCDIFASVFQDNNMGVVVGQRTMGGGGNVTQHGLSPVAKIGMALTESLVISPKGKYIEDNGVTPDIRVDMVADREQGFTETFATALKAILPPVAEEAPEAQTPAQASNL